MRLISCVLVCIASLVCGVHAASNTPLVYGLSANAEQFKEGQSLFASMAAAAAEVGNAGDGCEVAIHQVVNMTYREDPELCRTMLAATAGSNVLGYDACHPLEFATSCTVEEAQLMAVGIYKPWMVCVPVECTEADIVLLSPNATLVVHCGDNAEPGNAGTYTWIAFMILWVITCIVATVMDMYWQSQQTDATAQGAPAFASPRNASNVSMEDVQDDINSLNRGTDKRPLLSSEYGQPNRDSELARATPPIEREAKAAARQTRHCMATFVEICSLRKNCKELFGHSPGRKYKVLDGIRSFSMIWIICGHTIDFMLTAGFSNTPTKFLLPSYFVLFIFGAQFAVDSFFVLSGFLSSHILYRKLEKGSKVPIGMVIVLRFLRLAPLVAWVMSMLIAVTPYVGSGPIWYKYTDFVDPCYDYWWSTLVFVNNFVPADFHMQCLPWTWYLSNDFQYSILGMLLLVGYFKAPRGIWATCIALMLGCVGMNVLLTLSYDINPLDENYTDMIYDKPYTRLIPYVLGVIVCFIFNDKRYHVNAQNWSAFVRWLTMAVCCGFLLGSMLVYHTNVYGPEGQLASWTPTESAWYNALIHFTWSVPLCVILYLCLCNVGGPINWVLSLPIFEAMGKLTYAAYLLHPILMRITYYSTHQLYYYDVDNVTYFSYCAFFLLVTYALAIPVYVFIEMPFANMIGVALKKKAKK